LQIALKSTISVAESLLDFQLLIQPFILPSLESGFCIGVLLEPCDSHLSLKLLEQQPLDAFLLLIATAIRLLLTIFERTHSTILCS
jgi:hypothetical protein